VAKLEKMTKLEEQHKTEVAKLNDLESKLMGMIGQTENYDIMNLFNKWQEQRNECNSLYNEWLAETLKSVGK
jgi:hypothetical protein